MTTTARIALSALAAAALVGCASPGTERPAQPDPDATPAQHQADGDAALERQAYPLAANYYRRAAERADDERVAEQATQIAYDNPQQREAARR